MSAETDLSWDEWNQQHKGANRNNRTPRKPGKPHPLIVDGVKVHVHLIVPGKGGTFRTPDGNSWPDRAAAVAHMTKTAKQRAAKRAVAHGIRRAQTHRTLSKPAVKKAVKSKAPVKATRAQQKKEMALSNASKDWSMDSVKNAYEKKGRAERQAKRDTRVSQGLSPYSDVDDDATKHVREVHSNHVIVSKGYGEAAEHFHVPYDVTSTGFNFGAEKPVAQVFVPVAKKREMALSVIGGREIDLGKDGSKWRHGWIPLNASAAALKAHKGGGHAPESVSSPGEHMGKIREHVVEATREAGTRREGIAAHTPMHVGPNGSGKVRAERKILAGGTHTQYNVQTNENAGMHKSYTDPEKAAVALHRHLYGAPKDNSEKTAWRAGAPAGASDLEKAFSDEGMARDTYGHGSRQHEAARSKRMGIEAEIKKSDPGYTTGTGRSKPSVSSDMSPAAMVRNAETMYGTGSKQHLAAKKRFAPKVNDKYEAQLKGTAGAALQHLYAMRGTVSAEHKDMIAKELKRRGLRVPKRGSNDIGSKE